MKKAVSLALATVCATSCIVCPATAETQMTGGEALAMMFINEFFSPDEKAGINYSIALDQENKHFIITAQNQQLESLCGTDNENFEKYAESVMTLFDSVSSLVRTSTGDDDYYMTLTYYLRRSQIESPFGAYCCFSSKGGSSHRVNAEFVSTDSIKYYVADENAKADDIQTIIDYFSQKDCTLRCIEYFTSSSNPVSNYVISVSGSYCDAFLKNHKGKTEQFVPVPDKYVIDARYICNATEATQFHIHFLVEDSAQMEGYFFFSHSYWQGTYWGD